MPSTSGNPTWSAERRRTWWRTPATPCSCRSGSAPRTSCHGCCARCTTTIGRKCATRWSSPTGGSISTSRRTSSRRRGRPPRRASRSRPRTRSFPPGRGLRRREGLPNRPRGGAYHEEDRHWLRRSSDHDALVWAGVGLFACIRRARLLERQQLPWRLRLRWRGLLERQRCPRRLRLWWRGVLERQRWPRRLRLRWRGLVERRGWPRRLRLRWRGLVERRGWPRRLRLRRRGVLERHLRRDRLPQHDGLPQQHLLRGALLDLPSAHHRELLRIQLRQLWRLVHGGRRRCRRRSRRGCRRGRGLGQHQRRRFERLRFGVRRRQRCQPHVCDGRDLRDAACRLRHTHRPGRDLLSVWQYVVPAVLWRERRLLSRGAHALTPCERSR